MDIRRRRRAVGLGGGTAAAKPARDSFDYTQAGKHVKVWHYAPAGLAADAPVVIVMHGVGRNGEDYLNDWAQYADRKHFLLVVPEFSKAEFPGDEGYNYGNTVDAAGKPLPREEWSFSMIEPVFDAVRARTGNRSTTYLLYGHSAGAQFVQRFIYFVPAARYSRAVEANAGWYMLPDLAGAFPYGLRGTPVGEADLRKALARPLVVPARRGGHRHEEQGPAPHARGRRAGSVSLRPRPVFFPARAGRGRRVEGFLRLVPGDGAGHRPFRRGHGALCRALPVP